MIKRKKIKFTIDRSKWRCGGDPHRYLSEVDGPFKKDRKVGKGKTALLNSQGYQCCLGQMCLQAGFKKSEIKGVLEPQDLIHFLTDYRENDMTELLCGEIIADDDEQPELYADHYRNPSAFSMGAIDINDNNSLTQRQRETELRKLGVRHGVILKFVGECT